MALLFCDGFDHYLAADFAKKWTDFNRANSAGGVAIAPDYSRQPGGMGIRFTDGSQYRGIWKQLPSSPGTIIVGTAVYFDTLLPQFSWPFIVLNDGGISTTTQLDVRGDNSGHLLVTRNGTTLATSTNVVAINTWYYVELKATIHNTTGTIELRVNGSSTGWVPSTGSLNTRGQSAANQVSQVSIAPPSSSSGRFDDFYVCDTSGSVANDFLGGVRIVTIYPKSAGNYAEWAGNYSSNFANVNEFAGDGDNTFNQSSTANQRDTFGFDDIPSATIHAIQHVIMARQDPGTGRQIAALQRSGGTDYVGTTQNLAGGHLFLTEAKSTNPATSAQWTTSDVNGAEFGYKLIA